MILMETPRAPHSLAGQDRDRMTLRPVEDPQARCLSAPPTGFATEGTTDVGGLHRRIIEDIFRDTSSSGGGHRAPLHGHHHHQQEVNVALDHTKVLNLQNATSDDDFDAPHHSPNVGHGGIVVGAGHHSSTPRSRLGRAAGGRPSVNWSSVRETGSSILRPHSTVELGNSMRGFVAPNYDDVTDVPDTARLDSVRGTLENLSASIAALSAKTSTELGSNERPPSQRQEQQQQGQHGQQYDVVSGTINGRIREPQVVTQSEHPGVGHQDDATASVRALARAVKDTADRERERERLSDARRSLNDTVSTETRVTNSPQHPPPRRVAGGGSKPQTQQLTMATTQKHCSDYQQLSKQMPASGGKRDSTQQRMASQQASVAATQQQHHHHAEQAYWRAHQTAMATHDPYYGYYSTRAYYPGQVVDVVAHHAQVQVPPPTQYLLEQQTLLQQQHLLQVEQHRLAAIMQQQQQQQRGSTASSVSSPQHNRGGRRGGSVVQQSLLYAAAPVGAGPGIAAPGTYHYGAMSNVSQQQHQLMAAAVAAQMIPIPMGTPAASQTPQVSSQKSSRRGRSAGGTGVATTQPLATSRPRGKTEVMTMKPIQEQNPTRLGQPVVATSTGHQRHVVMQHQPHALAHAPHQQHHQASQHGQPAPIFSSHDLRGRVAQLCRDQHGSRFLQSQLDLAGSTAEKCVILDEVLPKTRELATDVFGNYVVQKVLTCGDATARDAIASHLKGHAVALSLHVYGCRVIQKALDELPSRLALDLLCEFKGNVLCCVHDQNGNHVVQKCVETAAKARKRAADLSASMDTSSTASSTVGRGTDGDEQNDRGRGESGDVVEDSESHAPDEDEAVDDVVEGDTIAAATETTRVSPESSPSIASQESELRYLHQLGEQITFILESFLGRVRDLAMHSYGCRVLQRVLEHCSHEQSAKLLDELREGELKQLIEDQYANYVVQHAIQYGRVNDRNILIACVRANLADFSRHKFASNVVEKCLDFGTPEEQTQLIDEIVGSCAPPLPGGGVPEDPTTATGGNLRLLITDAFANYVIQKVVDLANDEQLAAIVNALRPFVAQVKHTPGKHILSKLEKRIPGLKF